MVDHENHPSRAARPGQAPGQTDAPTSFEGERVAKVLARAGVASRRDIEKLIAEGRVALNGQVLTTPAVKIGRGDILTVNGQVVSDREPTRLWRYHKPVGLLTAHKDPKGRPTVFEHLPEGLPRVISIGRLDLASEGLLLLTNDGELARALEMPATGWVRQYRARAYGHATQEKLDKLKDGITVEGVRYGPIEAKLDKVRHAALDVDRKGPANIWVTVSITEGKNREVRRVLEHLGLKVNRLIRLAYGPFALATLPAGAAEEIGPRVIREQLEGLVPPEHMPPEKKGGGEKTYGLLLPKGRVPKDSRGDKPAPRRVSSAEEAAPKKEYKAGWAKPKKKLSPHGPPGKAKTGAAKPASAKAPRGTNLTFGKPTADQARQARVAKSESARFEGAKSGGAKSGGAKSEGAAKPRRSGPAKPPRR